MRLDLRQRPLLRFASAIVVAARHARVLQAPFLSGSLSSITQRSCERLQSTARPTLPPGMSRIPDIADILSHAQPCGVPHVLVELRHHSLGRGAVRRPGYPCRSREYGVPGARRSRGVRIARFTQGAVEADLALCLSEVCGHTAAVAFVGNRRSCGVVVSLGAADREAQRSLSAGCHLLRPHTA